MPHGIPPFTRRPERGRSNRFLATLPPHDFALLTPHLHTVTLERGTILHDAEDEIERVYFLHSGMVSLVAVLQSGAAVETATIGRAGVIGASTGLGVKYSFARAEARRRRSFSSVHRHKVLMFAAPDAPPPVFRPASILLPGERTPFPVFEVCRTCV